MEIGIDSFAALDMKEAKTYQQASKEAIDNLLEKIVHAEKVGLDIFGVGEHHRQDFADSAPTMILAAAAARTKKIRLTSAVTVLSAADPVRVFQEFATLDLISNGRAEMVIGRGSFVEAFPLFGYDLTNYDEIFMEKTDLLLEVRDKTTLQWKGQYRPQMDNVSVYPRPLQNELPIWIGVGGTPQSFFRAGMLGLPLMVAIIGGETRGFKPLIDIYREAGEKAGHPEKLKVGVHSLGYVADTAEQAVNDFYPGYAEMFTNIGKERGFGPVTKGAFEAQRGKYGALLVGDPKEIAEKILRHSEDLGGIERLTFQMDSAKLPLDKMLHSIELVGEVKKLVNK